MGGSSTGLQGQGQGQAYELETAGILTAGQDKLNS